MVKEIICTNGQIALCDDEDYPLLSRFSWFTAASPAKRKPYPHCNIVGQKDKHKRIPMHQLVMGGAFGIDHADNDGFNNQKLNLRQATYQENGWNRGKPKSGRYGAPSSQYKGVVRCVAKDGAVYYRVIIKLTKKGVKPARFLRLGPFDTEIEAAKAYNRDIVLVRGKWAWLNPIPAEAA